MQGFVCAPQDWGFCFSQSCGNLLIRSCWPSRSDSLGMPSSFVRSSRLGSLTWGSEPSHQENFFGVIVLQFVGHPPDGYGIWFCHDCPPPTCLLWLLCFWIWGIFLFFDGFQCPPVKDYSTTSCDFGALTGGDERMSFYSAMNRKPLSYNFNKNLSRALFILPLTHLQFVFHINILFYFSSKCLSNNWYLAISLRYSA